MTYDRAATAWASRAWNPQGWPCGPAPPSAPQPAGDSEGVTSATYWPRGTMFTVRVWSLELMTPSMLPRTRRLPLNWHSWSTSAGRPPSAGKGAGVTGEIVGSGTPGAVVVMVQGPPQPPPPKTFHWPVTPLPEASWSLAAG